MFENVVIAATNCNEIFTDKCCHYIRKLNISHNPGSWVFENVVVLIATMVMDYLMTLVK